MYQEPRTGIQRIKRTVIIWLKGFIETLIVFLLSMVLIWLCIKHERILMVMASLSILVITILMAWDKSKHE